ncbi:MAG: class I tRNA ligase family protein, partial [Candidatus Paceibacterota bacterium]
ISGGQKMSKSLGNVISPFDLVNEYGTDAVRYYLLREMPPFEDGDLTVLKFKDAYNANLANGLGNLVSRVMKMSENYIGAPVAVADCGLPPEYEAGLQSFEFNKSMDYVWKLIAEADHFIQESKPFTLYKTEPDKAKLIVADLVARVNEIGFLLAPLMPDTSRKIKEAVATNKLTTPLFPRKE